MVVTMGQLPAIGGPPTFTCSIQPANSAFVVWPYGYTLKYSVPADLHPVIKSLIARAGDAWITHLNVYDSSKKLVGSPGLSIKLVAETDNADIRFSLGDGSSFDSKCTVGNPFNTGGSINLGWRGQSKGNTTRDAVIWTQQEMERRSRHAWAHALGLPHINQLNKDEMISAQNISLLQSQYPPRYKFTAMAFTLGSYYRDQTPGIYSLVWSGVGTDYPQTSNMVTTLHRIDIAPTGDLCFESYVKERTETSFSLTCGWRDQSNLNSVAIRAIGFHPLDDRMRTGWIETANYLRNGDRNRAVRGERSTIDVVFNKPFADGEQISVQAWITRFKVGKGSSFRLNTVPSKITSRGFTLETMAYDDTLVYTVGVTWFAHRTHDRTIRSGSYRTQDHWGSNMAMEDRQRCNFNPSPFASRPEHLLIGFCNYQIPGEVGVRVEYTFETLDEKGFDIKVGTWDSACKYVSLGVSWVAIL